VALDLTVDFAERRLRGSATLSIKNLTGTRTLILDTDELTIDRVLLDGSTPATWSLGTRRDHGRPLTIDIARETQSVTIEYTTSPEAAGLFWNTAAQSYGREEPYLYSLNEPIDARSWIPIQDTPATRMTYDATLRVPPQLLALMSAENNPTATNDTGVYTFHMTRPIPAYLIALAVGRLEFRSFDERSGVYAEPELIEDAEWELQYVPRMIDAAESIAGPYPFARYDVLLMPPTFVAGGMEHPLLNFINPFSVVSGNHPPQPDPKLLIAHELAHSWAGDSSTLATWNDVWLNEGITSYLALRILEDVAGAERAELSYFLDRRSYAAFAADPQNQAGTVLHREVAWPTHGFSFTSYTKGELFLRTLEDLLGRATLDAFLRAWFEKFDFQWVDDRRFVDLIEDFIPPATGVRLHEWIYEPGLPSNITAPASSAIYSRAQQRANAFAAGTPIAQLAPSTWTDVEIEQFLQIAPANVLRPRMAEIDTALGLSMRVTPPLAWLSHAAFARYQPANTAVERALLRGGPNSWITQLYNALAATTSGRQTATEIFGRARKRYHPAIEAYVADLLDVSALRLRSVGF
jgi:aminopeptidase N